MGEFEFDRRVYARPADDQPKARLASSVREWLTLTVLILVIAGGGLTAYKMLGRASDPEPLNNDAQLAQIGQRIEALEHRLDMMEEKRKPSKPAPSTQDPGDPVATRTDPGPSAPAAPPRIVISPAPKPASVPSAPSAPFQVSPNSSASPHAREEDLSSLRGDVAATREQWVATADRLGNVVGELSSQREEITRNQESLEQLQKHLQKNSVPFALPKNGRKQRVGPVVLLLENTDTKNSRYTMRMLLDDKWIELKDRALNEAIQFYAPDGKAEVELIVSRIARSAVAGRVALPQTNVGP